jgi:hypothetical protein
VITRRHILILGWLLVLGLTALLPIAAVFRGIVHVGGTVSSQSMLDKPIIAIGSNVDAPQGTHAIILSLFGDVRVGGTATDNIVAFGGRVYLLPRAHVRRDVLSIVGGIYKAPGVQVDGRLGGALHQWNGKPLAHHRDFGSLLSNSIRLGLAAGLALLLAGACLTIVFPWQIVLISGTLRSMPLKSVAAGVAVLLTFLFLVIPLGLSLAGLPFALLLTAAGSLAWLFGMTAAAVHLGRLIARRAVSLLWAAAAGLVVLALTMAIPVVGPISVILVGLVGAGALAVSLIGRARPIAPLA